MHFVGIREKELCTWEQFELYNYEQFHIARTRARLKEN